MFIKQKTWRKRQRSTGENLTTIQRRRSGIADFCPWSWSSASWHEQTDIPSHEISGVGRFTPGCEEASAGEIQRGWEERDGTENVINCHQMSYDALRRSPSRRPIHFSENSRRLWLFPGSVRGFSRKTPGKSQENLSTESRNATNSRISGTGKGKPAGNLGSTLPGPCPH